jgi:hypothetical protein
MSVLHTFLESLHLRKYLILFFHQLKEAYSKLADALAKHLTNREITIGMNIEIMPLIQEFRLNGKLLEDEWEKVSPQILLQTNQYTFSDYYNGSKLITNIQAIYLKIYDFTNMFF